MINLDYSRVEVATDVRHRVYSCGCPSQMPCNEADTVRSSRLKSKKFRLLLKEKLTNNVIPFIL